MLKNRTYNFLFNNNRLFNPPAIKREPDTIGSPVQLGC